MAGIDAKSSAIERYWQHLMVRVKQHAERMARSVGREIRFTKSADRNIQEKP